MRRMSRFLARPLATLLAIAMTITGVPGVPMSTVMAAESGKVSYTFEGADQSLAWSADVIDYTAADPGSDEMPGSVTAYSFKNGDTPITDGYNVDCSKKDANATYTYEDGWPEGITITATSKSDSSEFSSFENGDTVTVSGYEAAVDPTSASATPITKELPDPNTAAGTGYTGAWSVAGNTLGTIAVNDGKFTLTSDQLVSVYESGEDVTITLTKTPKTYTAKYDVKFYDGDTQEEAPTGWTPIADVENALTFNAESALVTAPTFDGYDFSGWFEASDYSGTAITSYTATSDLGTDGKTFYGRFTKQKADETVKLTISGKNVASVSYQAFKGESADGEAVTDAALTEGRLEIDVNKGDTVKITKITTKNAYDMITSVKQGETSLEADSEDGSYETAALTDATAVTITTGKMLLDDIKLTANSNLSEAGIKPAANIVVAGNSEIEADKDKEFVKAGTDFAFTLDAKENYKIAKLTYAIGTETAKTIDITGIVYTIPKEDILAAVIAGKPITVTATVIEAKKKITVDIASAQGAEIKSQEYKVKDGKYVATGSMETVTFATDAKTATISVDTDNTLALFIRPASETLLTSNSVKIGNTKVAAQADAESGIPEGAYAITADSAKTVTITQYSEVAVNVTEAKKTVSGNTLLPDDGLIITKTTVSPYFGPDGVVTDIVVTPKNTQGDYDYEIGAPTAKYDTKAITVKPGSKAGSYVIAKADVEKAVEAGKDIEITATAKEIPKSTVSFKVSSDAADLVITEIKNGESIDAKHRNQTVTLTVDSADSTVKTGTITFQTGNVLIADVTIGSDYKAVDFVRATSSGKQFAVVEAGDGTYTYSLSGLKDGSTVEFATARIKADGDIYVASSSSSSSDKPGVWGDVVTRNSTDIILVGDVNYLKNDAELLVGFSTYGPQSNIKKYAVSNPQVTVNGSSANALSRSLYTNDELHFTEYYAIPANYLADIAFATPKTEAPYKDSPDVKFTYKAKITATATQVGYKSQPVFVNGDAGFTATVKDNGKKVLLSADDVLYDPATSGAAPLATGQAYLVEYGDQGVINIAPDAGFKLDSVTLLSSADYDKTVAAYATKKTDHGYSWTVLDQTDWDEAKKKKFADDIAALNKSQSIADDGTCTITLAKVQNAYSVVVTTKEDYALTVDGEVVDNTTEASPIENKYNNSLVFKLVSGGNEIDIATATVSYADGQNEDKSTKWTESAEAATVAGDKKSATISAEKMATLAGKLIKVDVTEDKSEGAVTKTAYFKVTDKLAAGALKLDLGDDTSLGLIIGSTKTVSLIGGVDSSRFSAEINSPYAGLIKVTKGVNAGKNTLTFTTAAADWNDLKGKGDIKLTLKDNVNDEAIGEPISVSVTADPLSVENLTVTASATANSIVLTMKGLDAEVKSLDGLYYLINASTTAQSCLISGTGNLLVPVEKGAADAEQKYTIKLTEDSDLLDPNPVEYTGTVALVQVSGTDEGWYDAAQKIAPSSDPETKAFSATTKTNTYTVEEDGKPVEKDVVFATKLKVNKLLGKTKVYTGMEAVDVISVEYPDAAKNVPVTDYAKKLQKVELVNTKTNDVWNTDYNPNVISEDNDVVTIYPENIAAGSYKVVAYALEPFGKEVTASYSFKVLQGIEGLTVTAPTTRIYKAPGKAATVKAALTYDPAKPATKKVVWSIADADGEDITIPGISVKDGKVTVDKNLAFDEDIEFTVKATAADYAGNDAYDYSAPITLTTTVSQPAYLTMGDEPITNNKKDYISEDIEGKTLAAYTADGTPIKDVSFKVSGAAKLVNDELVVTKLGKVNITATVTDGSVKKPFKVAFTIASAGDIMFMLRNSSNEYLVEGASITGATEYSCINNDAASEPMEMKISSFDGYSMIANSVSIKGGKAVNKDKVDEGVNYYQIIPSAHETVITITDKSVKPAVKYTIKVTNTKIAATKTATNVVAKNMYDSAFKNGASVAKDNKGKIFNHLEFGEIDDYVSAGAYNDVTYTVSAKGLTVKKVLLSVTKDDENEVFSNCVMAITADGVVTLGEGGTFTIRYADENGNFDLAKGTYSFTVTPVDDDGNAIAKAKVVNVAAAPAPKGKVTVKSTTLKDFDKSQNLVFNAQTNIVVRLNGDPATDSKTSAQFGADDKPQVLGINTKGIINRFASYFFINEGKLVCSKAPEAAGGYTQKSGISGWVAYTYQNLDGSLSTQYVKVTVKPAKDKDITAAELGD